MWVDSTAKASYFHINRRRGRKAFDAFVWIGLSSAPVVTDRYGFYEHLEQPHQYCLAHLIRDFHKHAERKGTDGEIGKSIEQELRQICRNHRAFCRDEISKRSRNARFAHQRKRLEESLIDGLSIGRDDLSVLCE